MPRFTYPEPTIQELIERIEILEGRLGLETAAVGFRETEQGIPNAVQTQIKLNAVSPDPSKRIDLVNGWYLVPEDGFYDVSGNLLLTAPAGEYNVFANIFVNKLQVLGGTFLDVKWKATEGLVSAVVSGIIFCKKGDHIELSVYQTSGAERKTAVGGSIWNRLSVTRVDVTSGKEGRAGENGKEGPAGPPGKANVAGGIIVCKWAFKGFFSETQKLKPGFEPKAIAFAGPFFAGNLATIEVLFPGGKLPLEPECRMHTTIELEVGSEFKASWVALE